MKSEFIKLCSIPVALLLLMFGSVTYGQNIDAYKYNGAFDPDANRINTNFQFNGYTNYWHDDYREIVRYGNLFKMAIPKADYIISQSKVDIAEDFNVPGLSLQEGFIKNLFAGEYLILDQPSLQKINESIVGNNILVLADPETEAGKKLLSKLPKDDGWKDKLKSHQARAKDFTEVNAFYLENSNRKIYVISDRKSVV